MNQNRLYESVRADVLEKGEHFYILKTFGGDPSYHDGTIFKEDLAKKHRVKTNQVEVALMRLNREGWISKPSHRAPHDSTREIRGMGHDSAWMGDVYRIEGRKWLEYIKELTGGK